MENTSENRHNKHLCTALLAHVDAGKTTLSESILYTTGSIRKLGRVKPSGCFFRYPSFGTCQRYYNFFKAGQIFLGDKTITLLDTPGHVDFSAEMERTLSVLDYAILLISGADGIRDMWRHCGSF